MNIIAKCLRHLNSICYVNNLSHLHRIYQKVDSRSGHCYPYETESVRKALQKFQPSIENPFKPGENGKIPLTEEALHYLVEASDEWEWHVSQAKVLGTILGALGIIVNIVSNLCTIFR